MGRPVSIDEVPPIDLIVCGSVAVNRRGTRVGKGGVLAYDEARAAKVAAAPVCFFSPVDKGDVLQHLRKKYGKRKG